MKLIVIGWYGTETIGDRAILAGLLSMLVAAAEVEEVSLGSLFPFFSERTLSEDYEFWKELTGADLKISLFDSSNPRQLRNAIDGGDVLIMGGGPLMHISEIHMVEYAFQYAKRRKKRSAVLGCGVGPVFQSRYFAPIRNIFCLSDVNILRDAASLETLRAMLEKCGGELAVDPVVALDPSVVACRGMQAGSLDATISTVENRISINLRDFPGEYAVDKKAQQRINDATLDFIRDLVASHPESEILLVPMHYFHVGDDDRYFLSRLKRTIGASNIRLQNKPLNLRETLQTFATSRFNVGMRFHSVVFQTLVSGRNIVLDYTVPKTGKIAGFIEEIDAWGFYAPRYFNLHQVTPNFNSVPAFTNAFALPQQLFDKTRDTYARELGKLL